MRTTQMAQMADECRAFTTGFNQTRMICAKAADHVDTDPYHHDPFHNVTWREIDATEAEIATRVWAHQPINHVAIMTEPSMPSMLPLRSGVVYVKPLTWLERMTERVRGTVFA